MTDCKKFSNHIREHLLFYRLVLLEEHPAVQGHVLPVPELHPGVVVILEVSREDALLGLAQHRVQPGVSAALGGEIACKEGRVG